jgi:subtilase family serine protease
MNRMLLVLQRSPEQEAALRKLLDDQQDKSSPSFHHWMTPEQFGQQFGPGDQDVLTITSWLQSHGFQVAQVSKGHTVIEFSGSAAQVHDAFHTSIHKYVVNGEEHWANASDPQIPAALAPVVGGVLSLHNFRAPPLYHSLGVVSRSKATGIFTPAQPLFTIPESSGCGVQSSNCYAVGPAIVNATEVAEATVRWSGTGVTATGTVTFFVDGTPSTGPVTYIPCGVVAPPTPARPPELTPSRSQPQAEVSPTRLISNLL